MLPLPALANLIRWIRAALAMAHPSLRLTVASPSSDGGLPSPERTERTAQSFEAARRDGVLDGEDRTIMGISF